MSLERILLRWLKRRQFNKKRFSVDFRNFGKGSWGIVVHHPNLEGDIFLYWENLLSGAWWFGKDEIVVQPSDPNFFPELTKWLHFQILTHFKPEEP